MSGLYGSGAARGGRPPDDPDDPAEIAERTARVREARLRAIGRGYTAPSADELTAALGDEHGLCNDARKRAQGPRKMVDVRRAPRRGKG